MSISDCWIVVCDPWAFLLFKPFARRFHSAGAGGKAGMFPELLPLPDAGSFVEDAVAEVVGEHQNLTAMMRLVREHVSEHGASGGPRWHPTVAREL